MVLLLAEAGQLPENTRFIKTYDDKADSKNHFKRFSIQEIPTNLISSIGAEFKIYKKTESPSRELVNLKMQTFLKSGFSILLIGERGTGKSQIASEAKKSFDLKNPFKEANCASFDTDSKAEAELFGYEDADAYTGAKKGGKKGLIEEAHGGILFLDEIHHLSKLVQAKLMKALQTDKNNRMSIRRMGGIDETKVECRIIFATNKTVAELRNQLLPDFYDRIVQHVVNIPALRETVDDRISDWKNIWYALKLKGKDKSGNTGWLQTPPDDINRDSWLKKLPLYGNYRDLQKIAMYYNAFNQFDDETKKMLSEKTPFQYAKNEFEKYHSPVIQLESEKYNFNIRQTTKEMIADYLFALQGWAVNKFHSRKAAIEHFQSLGDSVVEETFYAWKTKKSLKKWRN
jgi:transcriptional regulator with PAS, ATPase and Fis domain